MDEIIKLMMSIIDGKDISQRQLAKELGMTASYINGLFTGRLTIKREWDLVRMSTRLKNLIARL